MKNTNKIWFSDLKKVPPLKEKQLKEIVQILAGGIEDSNFKALTFSEDFVKDIHPRIVFISCNNGAAPASVYIGRGKGIITALSEAFNKFSLEWAQYKYEKNIKIDVVTTVKSLGKIELIKPIEYTRSLDGIAFSAQSEVALLPEQIVGNYLIDSKGNLNSNSLYQSLPHQALLTTNFAQLEINKVSDVYTFNTISVAIVDKQIHALYRGYRDFSNLTSEALKYHLDLAANSLVKSLYPSGRFDYLLWPSINRSSQDYNILRHAGTTYSMLEYYHVFPNPKVLNAAKQALQHLAQHILNSTDVENAVCVVEQGFVALGGNGLAGIAFAKYIEATQDTAPLPLLKKLGDWIAAKVKEDGEFKPHKQFYYKEVKQGQNFICDYYPGEAILALMRIHQLDPNPKWIEAAAKAALWIIEVRDKGVEESKLNHDHWLLYGLNELHRHHPHPLFLSHTIKICNAIIKSQIHKGDYPDWKGGFYNPPRSTPGATRSEGLYAAYKLLRDYGNDKILLDKILEAIKLSVAFQLKTQFLPEFAMYFKVPRSTLGAFHASLTDTDIRIDFTQHNISSLLGLYELLKQS